MMVLITIIYFTVGFLTALPQLPGLAGPAAGFGGPGLGFAGPLSSGFGFPGGAAAQSTGGGNPLPAAGIPTQGGGGAPYHHRDTDGRNGAKSSQLNAQSAQVAQAQRFKALEAQSAQASDAIFGALRAKSKGNSTAKGAKLSKSELTAESWDKATNWDEDVEAVEQARSDGASARLRAVDTGKKEEAAVASLDKNNQAAESDMFTHDEGTGNGAGEQQR